VSQLIDDRRAYTKAWKAANPDRVRASNTRYNRKHGDTIKAKAAVRRATPEHQAYHAAYHQQHFGYPTGRIKLLTRGACLRAAKTGLVFEPAVITTLMADPPTHCACCNVPFDFSMGKGRNQRHASPSLDRVDNRSGYTVANTRVICMRCNQIKSDATLQELEVVAAYMRRHQT
jgi:hypothetical protein